jgi:hypothetical protein
MCRVYGLVARAGKTRPAKSSGLIALSIRGICVSKAARERSRGCSSAGKAGFGRSASSCEVTSPPASTSRVSRLSPRSGLDCNCACYPLRDPLPGGTPNPSGLFFFVD